MKKSERGFTLIEIGISLGISALIVAGLMSQMKVATDFSFKEKNRMDAMNLSKDIMRMMERAENCTVTLQGLTLDTTSGAKQSLTGLFLAEDDPDNVGKLIKAGSGDIVPGQIYSQTLVDALNVETKNQLSGTLRTYSVEIQYSLMNSKFSSEKDKEKVLRYNFPPVAVIVELDSSNQVVNCVNASTNTAVIKERYCMVTTDGFSQYDPVTGECKDLGQWYLGSTDAAVCPSETFAKGGDPFDNCGVEEPPGFVDKKLAEIEVKRTYKDGSIDQGAPSYYMPKYTANRCSCTYASDMSVSDSSQLRCKILCYPNSLKR